MASQEPVKRPEKSGGVRGQSGLRGRKGGKELDLGSARRKVVRRRGGAGKRRRSGRKWNGQEEERDIQSVGGGSLGVKRGVGRFFIFIYLFIFSIHVKEGRGRLGGYESFEEEVEGSGERRRRSTEGVEGIADER
jgi:hypothetical protein